ncbi:group II intron reverse transcriptase/maturase [Endozoicomonas gorgoniicola]|uniref:RNA-directed DNA polymerase n=1 Tax=Endozoicomonas gorgoniicola TaxID=1234144 RepID=A0ABT3MQK2_9GAMM|nr:group II intron reverse transcriptase/maturase [Endozoicomonas gorgoniicola]MCW7551650.1 group II intron reverse transcriptase/maturase [Endozoicomonas gorgoniicola]MCW7551667.1 group II intron reverse transcriptase/maturase [Endozoicomonas gorgoniicola]MCW7553776.1 group II intron reverse transcriptase/maturase [Endozoicomonas gorgoniicola]MCW7554962.1 group II intron reverse transcriptase/maturase [Endozoicomonas gorgoniicola]
MNHDLLSCALEPANLLKAWKQVRSNKGTPGIDGITIEAYPDFARQRWPSARQALLNGTYRPSPVLRAVIEKPDGGERLLGIPTVMDRVIQQAIVQVLSPIFDPDFSPSSFGYRPGRSAQDAVQQVNRYIKQGLHQAVDVDLSKFFDTVSHDVLMSRVSRKIHDKRLLKLIGRYLRAGVMIDGQCYPTRVGMPQGGPLSPLLSNVLLDDLDKELEYRGHCFARYCDDFVILVGSQRAGERVMESITSYLERKLKLRINPTKSKVVKATEAEFLSFTFTGKRIRWSEKSLNRFRRKILKLTGRSWGVSMEYRLKKLTEYIRGWMGYFRITEYYSPIPRLDQWIRRRIRCCFIKQWRKPKTRYRNLIRLGVDHIKAASIAASSKGYYRLSKTYAAQLALNDSSLSKLGLVSLKDLWIRFHHPR